MGFPSCLSRQPAKPTVNDVYFRLVGCRDHQNSPFSITKVLHGGANPALQAPHLTEDDMANADNKGVMHAWDFLDRAMLSPPTDFAKFSLLFDEHPELATMADGIGRTLLMIA